MGSHTLQQLRGYSFDEIKTLFETTMRGVNTFVPIESEVDRAVPELAVGSSKRDAEEELDQESSKRQKTGESSELAEEPRDKEADELSQEELQQMMIIVPEQGMNVEALVFQGIMLDGVWYTKPKDIKSAFLDFYKDKFSCHDSLVSFPPMLPAHRLSISVRDFLESMVSMDEIKAAVWDCGSQKALGLDGYSFMFIKKFSDLLKHDIQSFVVRFFSTGTFPKIMAKILANRLSKVIDSIISLEQSAFITGHKILDDPLILNETID
ncbi:hypothetical protein Tco_1120101, partial [Tanacetum coccineum]